MITKPRTLRNGLIEIPAIRRAEAGEEADAGYRRPSTMDPPDAGAAQGVHQLGVISSKCSFHLLEKPLLLV